MGHAKIDYEEEGECDAEILETTIPRDSSSSDKAGRKLRFCCVIIEFSWYLPVVVTR